MFRRKKNIGLFFIHGFTDVGPDLYKDFINLVKKRTNFKVHAVNLQGHSCLEDLINFNYKTCISEVTKAYSEFKEDLDEVYLLGFSMGGVIASYLASEIGCNKLVLLAPSFKYIEHTKIGKDIFDLLIEEYKALITRKTFRDSDYKELKQIISKKYKKEAVVYNRMLSGKVVRSIKPYLNFALLVDHLKKKITLKDIPVRIYHGEYDELVPLESSIYIFRQIQSRDKRLIVLPHVYHSLLHSSIKHSLSKEIIRFLKYNK